MGKVGYEEDLIEERFFKGKLYGCGELLNVSHAAQIGVDTLFGTERGRLKTFKNSFPATCDAKFNKALEEAKNTIEKEEGFHPILSYAIGQLKSAIRPLHMDQ